MDAYELQEGRFLQRIGNVSVVDGLTAALPGTLSGVPDGKIWTILQAVMYPSVSETQDFWWEIYDSGTTVRYPILNFQNITISSAKPWGMLTEGLEIKLWPGDFLRACRAAATAGSTLSVFARILETDMPLYHYDEPQIVLKQKKALSSVRTLIGRGSTGSRVIPGPSPGVIPRGGGGGRPPAV